ncbi:MAG TPA: peptidoglycan bridge formation glycyltransferase FemA/FemB family protein [Thermoflexia bacterium]|nr:peptidoglycan bridge formation glycyltransferase FemA/FemB family protein [Thermoflexia bacterium]
MSYLDLTTPTHKTWDAFVAEFPGSSILQTTCWGRLKADFGWNWEIVALGRKRAPTAGALVLYKQLPLKLGTIAYVPRGPLVAWDDEAQLSALLQNISASARRHRAWALWMEPERLDKPVIRQQLPAFGFRSSPTHIQPPRTILVDLAVSEEEILTRMKSKTRYNIRYAERQGITVRQGSVEDAALYYGLMAKTGQRNEFGIHSETYYRRVLELFLPPGNAALLIAEVEAEPVAAIIVFTWGEKAWYMYGASADQHRNKMPTYALQWAAIKWAQARGCTTYDLWGVPDYNEEILEDEFTERSDGLWGVYRFKRGFGGQVVRFAGLWEKVLNPLYPLARKAQQRASRGR